VNRTFKSVWNATSGTWIAASEMVSGKTKNSAVSADSVTSSFTPRAALFLSLALSGASVVHAATYTASTEAELVSAISQANADGDPSSIISLTSNITITNPAALPAATKLLTVSPGAFTLATTGTGNIGVATGATLTVDGRLSGTDRFTKDGSGTLVLTGTGSLYTNRMVIGAGALRVQNGGQITFGSLGVDTSGLQVIGDNVSVTITGTGSLMHVREGVSTVGSVAGSSLTVEKGGEFRADQALRLAEVAGTTGSLRVDGAGSMANVHALSIMRGTGSIDVTAGGRVESATFAIGGMGALLSLGGSGAVTVTGPGSMLINASQGGVHDGSLTILDGGVMSSGYLRIGNSPGLTASVTVSGTGSELISTSSNVGLDFEIARAGDASLKLANGGKVSARAGIGAIKIASAAAARGTLSIGGALGQAAEAPGVLEAASIQMSVGAATVDFNHTDGSYNFAVPITGTSATGVVSQSGPGTTVLTGANTYAGATRVTAGTLRAGAAGTLSAASAYTVATGGTLDLAGFSHTIASMANAGTVSLMGGAPGTTLTVAGPWVGNGGTLRLGTALDHSASVSDRLILDGASAIASGTTHVQVVNQGGLGALTSGNGIEVVSALNGATTTAQTTRDAFALAGGHVDAGAFEYRLYAADASGAGENWYLRSAAAAIPSTDPGTSPVAVPTYREEVPLFAALPEQLRQGNLVMLGNLHQRVGDGVSGREAWGRVISTDRTVSQTGTVNQESEGRLTGFQAGTDLWTNTRWHAGVYVGQLDGDMSVTGFARGTANLAVGSNDLRSQFIGGYATYRSEGGFYADAVLQAGRHRYTISPNLATASNSKGDSLLASLEIGKGFPVGDGWVIEPQLQLMHQRVDLDDVNIGGATVQQDTHDGWTARAGVRLKGEISTAAGVLQPYGRFNVYKSGNGTDVTRFIGPAAATDIASQSGGSSTELAAGATLRITQTTSLYGELGKLWASGGSTRSKSGINAGVGVRMQW
jgi:outer membrane autotransporter protein